MATNRAAGTLFEFAAAVLMFALLAVAACSLLDNDPPPSPDAIDRDPRVVVPVTEPLPKIDGEVR